MIFIYHGITGAIDFLGLHKGGPIPKIISIVRLVHIYDASKVVEIMWRFEEMSNN